MLDPNGLEARVAALELKLKQIDTSSTTPFHTLGLGHLQAASGDHDNHLDGITLSGAKGGSAVLISIVAALVALGATDSTT